MSGRRRLYIEPEDNLWTFFGYNVELTQQHSYFTTSPGE
jgi:hypothetical protein